MAKRKNPRYGSMQFWPRVRAKRPFARVRTWAGNNATMLGFAGYKAGMTHAIVIDNRPTSITKGEKVSFPVTIIECPPIKVAGIRFYKDTPYGSKAISQILADNLDKELARAIVLPKKHEKKQPEKFDDVTLMVYTQPKLTGIGKKKPELFEIPVGGKNEEKMKYAQEKLGKEIMISEIFREGEQLDVHSVTKGKGFQGPMKRFGIHLRSHKSEKSRRNPGSLGAWCHQGHIMYRVAHAGRMGFAQRTEYNKLLLKVGAQPEQIQQKGGFVHYGVVKNPYVLVKGSIGGTKKRLITLSHAVRPAKNVPKDPPTISYISQAGKQ